MEQLLQENFSDFPIGSPDIGRKSRKSPLFDAEYLGNGKCYDNVFPRWKSQNQPYEGKIEEAEILDLGVFKPEKKEYEIGFSKFDQKWSTACRGRNLENGPNESNTL